MKNLVLIIIPALICGLVFTSCESDVFNEVESGKNIIFYEVENLKGEDIATVQAKVSYSRMRSENQWQWETYYYKEYEIANFAKFENGFLFLNLSSTIPDEYLYPNYEKVWPTHGYNFSEGVIVSDINARTNQIVLLTALNSAGEVVGDFFFGNGGNYWGYYVYADRDFIEKGISESGGTSNLMFGGEFDCAYQKGWNICYNLNKKRTTQKPLDEDFKWYFEPYVPPVICY